MQTNIDQAKHFLNPIKSGFYAVVGMLAPATGIAVNWLDIAKGVVGLISAIIGIGVGYYCLRYWRNKVAWQERQTLRELAEHPLPKKDSDSQE